MDRDGNNVTAKLNCAASFPSSRHLSVLSLHPPQKAGADLEIHDRFDATALVTAVASGNAKTISRIRLPGKRHIVTSQAAPVPVAAVPIATSSESWTVFQM